VVYLGDLGTGRDGEDGGSGGDVDSVRAVAAGADNVDGVVQAVDPDAAAQYCVRQPHDLHHKAGSQGQPQRPAEIQSITSQPIPIPHNGTGSARTHAPPRRSRPWP
jgi:hypothetical protein